MNQSDTFHHSMSNNGHGKPEPRDGRHKDRWAIILAGGDGTRLRPLTQVIAGDKRPKQFCAILGTETLLNQTRRRTALVVDPVKTVFALTQDHSRFYQPLLNDVSKSQLVVQPKNTGTAPAILYSLMRVSHVDSDSSVAIFPSDHYVSDDAVFMSYVESAFESVRGREDLIVLLGIQPDRPETEYGWIEPLSSGLAKNPDALSWVRRFWEKPPPELASDLMKRGCLWNSFVMIGRVGTFLKMIYQAVPELLSRFLAIEQSLDTPNESKVVSALYSYLPEVHFSNNVLAARTGLLAVLPVTGLIWNDLGKPERVLSTIGGMSSSSLKKMWATTAWVADITNEGQLRAPTN